MKEERVRVFNEKGIGRQFKMPLSVGLNAKGFPYPLHRHPRQTLGLGHAPYAPVRGGIPANRSAAAATAGCVGIPRSEPGRSQVHEKKFPCDDPRTACSAVLFRDFAFAALPVPAAFSPTTFPKQLRVARSRRERSSTASSRPPPGSRLAPMAISRRRTIPPAGSAFLPQGEEESRQVGLPDGGSYIRSGQGRAGRSVVALDSRRQ
jgi:hypothetical protein